MAVRSVIKNKKNQKMREAIDDIAVKCGDTADGEGIKVNIVKSMARVAKQSLQLELLIQMMENMNVKLDERERSKLEL